MKKYIFFLFLLPHLLQAQERVKGEMLIWTSKPSPDLGQALCPQWPLYRYTFDEHKTSFEDMRAQLLRLYPGAVVQGNRYLSAWRNAPNDPQYERWQADHLERMGLLRAWAKTTGGLSPNGDTIVLALIDGGADWTHPDLQANIWRNHLEIPDNGLDDDQNGYVDDHLGWNAGQNNGQVFQRSGHGTSVAGIMGAVGNNAQGVAGINWQVKLMLLSLPENLPITEANVLVAYAYLWQQRRLYNQTGGQQGAYLVASNGSFGIDRGRAEDYPLWCAMIDSLGQEGVLTVASTANLPLNVEQTGDMPTTCPSPYLIAVTQTDVVSDALYPSSAYGAQSIDLAAPGAVYTTRLDSSYNVFGGTSGAAPHVAGAVGLLYALPQASWGQLQRQDRSAAALLVKSFLLQSVDPQLSLKGKTLSGGRLQLGRAMEQLEAYFVPAADWQLQILSDPLSSQPLVQVDLPQAGVYEWQLYDALGRRCWQQVWTEASPGRRWLRLALPELAAGVYVLRLQGQGRQCSVPWIKGR